MSPSLIRFGFSRGMIAALSVMMTAPAMADPDVTGPSVAVTSPVPGSTLSGRTFGPITGTAADDVELASVQLKIERVSDGKFWDGVSAWSTVATALPAVLNSSLGTWTSTGRTPWLVAGDYKITATAKDAAGNETPMVATVIVPQPAVAFTDLGLAMTGTYSGMQTSAVSWDGAKVVGAVISQGSTFKRAFRWSAAGGFETLADLAGGTEYSEALAVSSDGNTIVGFASSTDSVALDAAGLEAARWTEPATVGGIGDVSHAATGDPFTSKLFAASADGSMTVGYGTYKHTDNSPRLAPVRWTAAGGFQELGDLPGGGVSGESRGISGDGSIVVGYGNAAPDVVGSSRAQAFRWTEATGMVALPDALKSFPGTAVDRKSVAYGISADGSTSVGYFSEGRPSSITGVVIERRTHAVRWTADGIQKLGQLTSTDYYSIARAASGDGKVIVGTAKVGGGMEAFVWREGEGMYSIQERLSKFINMNEIWLYDATGISADGYTITGKGGTPFGEISWVVTLPTLTPLSPGHVVPPGQMLTATPAFTPKITFSESNAESVKTTTETFDGETFTSREVVGAGSNTATLIASTAGIDLTQVNGSTEVMVSLGSFVHSATLDEDPTYIPAKTSVSFKLTTFNILGNEVTIGTVKYAWNAKTLTVTITCSNSTLYSMVFPDYHGEEVGAVSGKTEASVGFAGVGGTNADVYVTGNVARRTQKFGSGDTAEEFILTSVTVSGGADYTPPVVTYKTPAANLRTTAETVKVEGTMTDAHPGDKVLVRINGGSYTEITPPMPTSGTSVPWQLANVALVAGPNLIEAKSTDASGNESLPVARKVTRIVMTPLAVSHIGDGKVSAGFEPSSNREIGAAYTITATPGKGQVFNGWTGITSSEPKLTFTMTEGLSLAAHFIPTPFPAIVGTYGGLVTSTNPSVLGENGSFILTPTTTGTLTFKLFLGGNAYSATGVKLNNDGSASFSLSRGTALPPLLVTLQVNMDPTDGHVTGTLTSTGYSATLAGDRTVIDLAHPVPAGAYTLLFPKNTADPAGASDGSASLVIAPSGVVTVIGRLSDTTSFTATSNISKSGAIPLFASIVKNVKSIGGVLQFDPVDGAPKGTLHWLHGTDTALDVIGSAYSPPAANKRVLDTLDVSNGVAKVSLSSGGLAATIEKAVTISTSAAVTVKPTAADKLAITILKNLGTFTGSFIPPGTTKSVPLSGVFFETQNAGVGLFTRPDGTVGHVRIEAASSP